MRSPGCSSPSGNRSLVNQPARYEAERTSFYLGTEDPEHSGSSPGASHDIEATPCRSPIVDWRRKRDPRWRLVNRICSGEWCTLGRVRSMIDPGTDPGSASSTRCHLVPAGICERLEPITEEISAAYQQQILEQFGEVQEEAFPPCISALIQAIATGTNISHMGRFAVTSFLHTVGMSGTGIVEMFAQAPDFDLEKTMYQVDHISGGGGTEYTPPSCPTMRTFGLCVNPNKDCERVNHPLRYYRLRKTRTRRPG